MSELIAAHGPPRPAGPSAVLPDVELLLCEWLRQTPALAGVFVGNKVPHPRRDRMIVVRRDGGQASGVLDSSRVGIQIWDKTPAAARLLADATRQALATIDLRNTPVRSYREVLAPIWSADTSEQPRLYMTAEIITRAL